MIEVRLDDFNVDFARGVLLEYCWKHEIGPNSHPFAKAQKDGQPARLRTHGAGLSEAGLGL
jgi:hypothetical protein